MRYMMLLSGTNPATPPPPELFEAIMKLGGEATQAGVMLDTAGLLRADPAYGFGPGAPADKAVHISWHAAGHLISASIGFTALIVACFVVARYFSRERHRGLAIYSRATGLAFLAAFAGVTTGSDSSAIVLPFYAGVLIAWIWIAVTSVHLYRRAGASDPAGR